MFDADDFKTVNDRFGHLVGDEVLKQMSAIAVTAVRDIDIVGRYGGEEFIIGLIDTSLDEALKVAERIRYCMASHHFPVENESDGCFINVTASFGVSSMFCNELLTDLIRRADQGIYRAKASGKNCVKTIESE